MYTSIVNKKLARKLEKRLELDCDQEARLKRKFLDYKDAAERKMKAALMNDEVEVNQAREKARKARAEFAEEIARLINESGEKEAITFFQKIQRVAGVSLALRAIEDLDEEKTGLVDKQVLENVMAYAKEISKKMNDTTVTTSSWLLSLFASGSAMLTIDALIAGGATTTALVWGAGFAASSAILMGIFGLKNRHLFHQAMVALHLKPAEKEN